ncbi:MAG: Nudix family hydrolase [Gammaproteobacteria bacterium]|nr:Nudix family hydrolase [Gammaproteobacteria bacterium]
MLNTEVSSPSSIHVVAGIIRHPKNPGKIFFTRRKKGQHLQDLWEFPGGKLEEGESRFQALQRELEEEVGIQVHSALPFHSLVHQYQDKTIFLDVWEVKLYSGRAHGREGQQSEWLALEELSEYSFPEADLPILRALSLPAELLITPRLFESELDLTLQHFSDLVQKQPYPLVLFRSDHLDDESYLAIAIKLQQICEMNHSQLIISRPDMDAMKSKLFDSFNRLHINTQMLRAVTPGLFNESIILSASCRDKTELVLAESLNCDFALLSAVKQTASFPGRAVQGWFQFNKIASLCRIPVFALGGVQGKDLTVARYQGAVGVAGTTKFWGH